MKHHDPSDETVTHFTASKRKNNDRFFITLYRFMEVYPAYGQTECHCTPELKERGSICHFCMNKNLGIRPQYKGPMGWKFHTPGRDPRPEDMHPIEELPAITGDDMVNKIFNPNSMYAG